MNTYNIELNQFNGVDYDVLYPVTTMGNVMGLTEALGNKATMDAFTITLSSSGWLGDGTTTPYTQQVSVSGTLSTDNIFISIIPSSTYTTAIDQFSQFQYINYTTPLNGAIKFTCLSRKPTIALPIKVVRLR